MEKIMLTYFNIRIKHYNYCKKLLSLNTECIEIFLPYLEMFIFRKTVSKDCYF